LHFQNLVEHVNTGIIQFDNEGNVEVINKLAKDFFQCGDINNLKNLDQKIPGISTKLLGLKLGSSKSIKIYINETFAVLNFKISEFKVEGECKKLVSFQNIKEELEFNETDSWKKLIRVLTHEIMNSTAPISSSIKVITSLLRHENSDRIKSMDEISKEDINNTVRGLGIIEERSEGLNQFVQSYRELTKNIEPYFTEFKIIEIFKSIGFLFAEDFRNAKIKFQFQLQPEDLRLKADKNLVEQVIINLIKNSIEATSNTMKRDIRLESFKQNNRIIIRVTDTGEGISLEESDKIFIPFFTSKEEGSGIGLSLSRQIMQLHNGSITFESKQGTKTEFILKF
jgi:nitrogen fixation/metabolism regulation signal transduction histidine kinase